MNKQKYDGLLYGNGLSILLLSQLKQIASPKYVYEFSFSDFTQRFAENTITEREKRELSKLFDSLFNSRGVRNTYDDYRQYISGVIKEKGVDFEQILGRSLISNDIDKQSQAAVLHSIYPVLYNYWGNNTVGLINSIFKDDYLSSFCESIKLVLSENAFVFTTNLDAFTDRLKPEHLHGRFVSPFNCEKDLVYKFAGNNGDYYYKFIWGHNGAGKFNLIRGMHNSFDDWGKFFGWGFFYDNQFRIENLLVFGMGFKNSAYSSAISPYHEQAIQQGFVIDDHILFRLNKLQNNGQVKAITIAYYSEDEKNRFEELASVYELRNTVIIPSNEFDFKI